MFSPLMTEAYGTVAKKSTLSFAHVLLCICILMLTCYERVKTTFIFYHYCCNGAYNTCVTYFLLYLTTDATAKVLCLMLVVAKWLSTT